MAEWRDELAGPLQIFYVIGLLGAAFLALQVLLLAVGVDGDFGLSNDDGISGVVSFRGLAAFFFVLGWLGVPME